MDVLHGNRTIWFACFNVTRLPSRFSQLESTKLMLTDMEIAICFDRSYKIYRISPKSC